MITIQTKIINKTGLHARPASEFIQEANKYKSKITIRRLNDDNAVDVKSIMNLLMLGLCQGDEIVINADGNDEKMAVENLVAMIENGFGE